MKAKNTIWKRISVALVLSVAATFGFLISCEKENIQPLQDNSIKSAEAESQSELFPLTEICGSIHQKALLIGSRTKAGDVYIFNDTKYLYVHVSAGRYYEMKNVYLFAGSREDLPLTIGGDLAVKRFNHVMLSDVYTSTRRFKIPLSELEGRFVVSLKAEVKRNMGESSLSRLSEAWADGKPYGITSFGRVFSFETTNCLINDPVSLDQEDQ